MIYLLACRCHSSVPLIRKYLREAHIPDWATLPICRGRAECLQFISTLPKNLETGSLDLHIRRNSSWAVILGVAAPAATTTATYRWVDIGHANVKDKLDAELILEEFYDFEH